MKKNSKRKDRKTGRRIINLMISLIIFASTVILSKSNFNIKEKIKYYLYSDADFKSIVSLVSKEAVKCFNEYKSYITEK